MNTILLLSLLFQQPTSPVAVTRTASDSLVQLWRNRANLDKQIICLRGYADMSDSTLVISSVYPASRCLLALDDSIIGALYMIEAQDFSDTEEKVLEHAQMSLDRSDRRYLLIGAMHGLFPVTSPNGKRHLVPAVWAAYRFPADSVKE